MASMNKFVVDLGLEGQTDTDKYTVSLEVFHDPGKVLTEKGLSKKTNVEEHQTCHYTQQKNNDSRNEKGQSDQEIPMVLEDFFSYSLIEDGNQFVEGMKCLVAVARKLMGENFEDTLRKILVDEFKPACIICPFEDCCYALIGYNRSVDASSVLKDMEVRGKMQTHEISLGPMLPQVVHLKASFDITKFMLKENRTLHPDIVERNLIESSGVKIEKSLSEWYLKGTLPQLQKANEYLRILMVEMAKQQDEEINVSRFEENSDTTTVTVEYITKAVYCAYLFFSNSHDSDHIRLHYDSSKNLVEIKGTYKETQKTKCALERLQKTCECLRINISGKKLSITDLREKLRPIREKQSQVYIHINEKENVDFVDEISFLGFIEESIKQVKSLVFEKLRLATNRRNRFAVSVDNKMKDFALPQSSVREGNTRQNSLSGSATRERESRRVYQKSTNRAHFKAADKFPVIVFQGDILNLDVDCIVNAANSELDHGGGVAGAIADAAGPQFVRESRNYVKQYGKIKVGHSCHTSAGRLKYKFVIHTVGPRWNDYRKNIRYERCSEELRQAVESAVLEANNCGMASVAIPAISSGIYGVPHEVCVTQYALGVIGACTHLDRQHRVSLQKILFVDKNFTLINMMKNEFQEFLLLENEAKYPDFLGSQDAHLPSSEHEDSLSPPGSNNFPHDSWEKPGSQPLQDILRFDSIQGNVRDQHSHETTERVNKFRSSANTAGQQNDLYPYSKIDIDLEVFKYIYQLSEFFEIQVYSVDILDINVDGLVFEDDKGLQTRSKTGRAIRNIDTRSFDKEVDKIKAKKLKVGNVYILQLENVRQRVIFLLVIPSWGEPGTTHGDCIIGLEKGVINVLKTAAECGVRSIAMPVLGTSNKGATVGEAAKSIIEKIQEYFSTADKNCPLKQVHLVSKDEHTVNTIKTIMDGKLLKKREIHDRLN